MPSIIPGYVYSLFAALLVGAIIVYSCSLVYFKHKKSSHKPAAKEHRRIRSSTKPNTAVTHHRRQPEHHSISRYSHRKLEIKDSGYK